MPQVSESQVVATELERVLPRVEVLFESDDFFYANIKKRDVEVVSYREMRVPMEIRPGGKFKYFNPNGGDLGRGGGPVWDKATLRPVFMAEGIEYTKLTQYSTDDKRKAIQDAVRRLTAGAMVEFRRQNDSQLMQDGTGKIGTAGTVTANTPTGSDTVICNSDGFGVRLMRADQVVQIYDTNMTTFRGLATITYWDEENKTIQLTPNTANLTSGDVFITDGLSAPTALPALYGVPYHHSNSATGTWLGYDRATNPEIRSNRVNAASAALALPQPRLALNKIGNRVGRDNNFKCVAWTHPCQAAAYEDIGQLIQNIYKDAGSSKDGNLNLYFGGQKQLAGAPMKEHFNWNQKRIDFVVDSVWGRGETLPIGFYTSDGRRIFELRGPTGGVATAEIFYMVTGYQTFLTNPGATAYIDNLAVPSGY